MEHRAKEQSNAPLLADFRDRCRRLGLRAWSFVDGEPVVDAADAAPAAGTSLAEDVARVLAQQNTPGRPIPVADGWIFATQHKRGSRVIGTTLAFAPALLAPHQSAASLLAASLAVIASDTVELDESRTAIAGFTSQLSESFDTIDLLYSVGRSMRRPMWAEPFMTEVSSRLHTTMNFGWTAVRFSSHPMLPTRLRDLLVHVGTLPRAESIIRRAADSLLEDERCRDQWCVFDAHASLSAEGRPQVLVQPLTCKGQTVGFVMAGAKGGQDPDVSSYDIQLIEAAAGYINTFSDNVAHFEDQHALFTGTVQALAASIDAKDQYTRGHSERVAYLSAEIGRAMGMSKEEIERIRIGGIVHDVGKIGVPESVLTKPSRLTDEEFEKIKLHPEIGHRILKDIPQLADVLPGVLHHHERFDGKGYPHGLAGKDIPLIARIMAIADTFDAMSSTRAYRPAMPREKVLAEFERCAGTQFDPEIVPIFLGLDLTHYDELVARHSAGAVTAIAA